VQSGYEIGTEVPLVGNTAEMYIDRYIRRSKQRANNVCLEEPMKNLAAHLARYGRRAHS